MTQETVIPGSALNFSLDFGAADTTKTFTIKPAATSKLYPYFYRGFAVIPDWTNVVTLTVTIVDDADGNSKTLYTSSALAKNGTREMTGITGELPYEISIVATLSGVPGGTGGTVYFTFYSTENASGANASVGASVNVAQINSVTPQLDDTDKLAVSIYGKSVAAGDVALLLDAAGNPQVDVVSAASDTDIGTIATNSGTIASDTTNILADTGSMDTNLATLVGTVSGTEVQVDVVSAASDTDISTIATNSGTIASDTTNILADTASMDGTLTNILADTASIDTNLGSIAGAVAGTEVQVDVISAASDTDISTIATNSGTIASDTTNILADTASMDTNLGTIAGDTTSMDGTLTSILADTASMDTNLATLAGAVSGTEVQVDVVSGGTLKNCIKTNGAIIDLVGSGSAPTEIDTSAATVIFLNVSIEKKCRCCFAADSTAAATAIASDTTSWFLQAGAHELPVNGSALKFYIRSFDATGLTDGCSYTIEETV